MNKEDVIGFEALYETMQKCKRGVMWKDSVAHYVLNAVEETIKLEESLKNGTYKARPPRLFKITCPKERDIVSVSFRDRVFQRSLNDNSIYPQISRTLIYDNAACQKDKGTDFARKRLTCFLQRHYRKHGKDGFVLQCDIAGYYPNMRHDVAEACFKKHLDSWSYERAVQILHTQYPGEVGYGPGSQMIQLAGILVLSDLDHFIKERLRAKHYIRYMDDFIIISESKEYLEKCLEQIGDELHKIGFTLHPKKTRIYPLKEGIQFLGFIFRLTGTGKVLKLIIPKNVKAYRKKLRRLVNLAKKGRIPSKKVDDCYKSWRSHAAKGNTYKLLERMDAYYASLWEE